VTKETKMKRSIRTALLTSCCAIAASAASAQEFKHPIRFVVPFGAGGATDVLARLVATRIGKDLGQTVIIENKPGAGGQIGTQSVKGAPPDGSVFLVTTEHPLVVLPHITPNIGYSAEKDFAIMGKIANLQWALSAPASTGVKSMPQLIDYVRGDPTRGNFGIPLTGGIPTMIGSVIARKGAIEMTPIPYAGGAPMVTQLLGGQLSTGVTGTPEAASMQRTGKVVVLALAGSKRSTHLANVPTFKDLGYPDLDVDSWIAVFAPKGLPPVMAEKFNAALRAALAEPEVRNKIADLSLEITPTTLDEASKEYTAALAFWARAYKQDR
jgi:tripartite-type tricarboxylate transporter receptor subunit TctC